MIRKGLLAAAPLLAALIVTLGATRAYAIPKFVETGQPQDITAALMGNVGNIQVLFTSNPGDVEGDDALTDIFRANGNTQTVAGTESGAALFLNIDGTPLTRNQYNGLNALGPESLFSSVIFVEGADGSGWSDTVNVFLNGGGTGVRLMFVSDRAGATELLSLHPGRCLQSGSAR